MARCNALAPHRLWLARIAGSVLLATALASAVQAGATWTSGVRNNEATQTFAAWRGTSLKVVTGWIEWKAGWAGMYAYAGGVMPRTLRAKSPNVSFGHGLFPQGGDLAACAAGDYDDEQRTVAGRLAANGVGDAEIRLGWEASGDWFPWTAVGRPPEQWKACFTHVAKAMKAAAPRLRIGWFMAKKGRIDVRSIYPDGAPITNIGISHYDDGQERFGDETSLGGPWGLRAWLAFARGKGRRLAIGEWGVGRRGDNPAYIQAMYGFLREAGDAIAYEAYFNTGKYQLYPVAGNPRSSALYRQLF
ncbi:MAG: hypothetical protein AB7I59_01555 [Geminicoccaceae bacterium]